MNTALQQLQKTLKYQFRNLDLMAQALTHRSAAGRHNERIEFLGDGVLNFIIAEALYHRYPKATEGELSRLRASLVRETTLAEIAREYDLGSYLRLGSGELKSGGYRRESILADTLEALFGAVYLDSEYDTCREFVLRLFDKRLDDANSVAEIKDAKSRLQEWLQSRRLSVPTYTVLSTRGDPHDQTFYVQCHIEQLDITTEAAGSSRRRAEQGAAEAALTIILERKLP